MDSQSKYLSMFTVIIDIQYIFFTIYTVVNEGQVIYSLFKQARFPVRIFICLLIQKCLTVKLSIPYI